MGSIMGIISHHSSASNVLIASEDTSLTWQCCQSKNSQYVMGWSGSAGFVTMSAVLISRGIAGVWFFLRSCIAHYNRNLIFN